MIRFENISKKYDSKFALKDISFQLETGIYGLLGPNGAGKSTLINILTNSIKQTTGKIYYKDKDIFSMGSGFLEKIGFVPQQQNLYSYFTGRQFLYYICSLKGIEKTKAFEEVEKALRFVDLWDNADKKIGAYSGGMKQRILIAQSILGNPEILILDEPTVGLDPKERIRIRNLISEIALGKIVIMATHIVSDIECIADELLLLGEGELISKEKPERLIKELSGKVFTLSIKVEEVQKLQNEFLISNMNKSTDGISVRILSEEKPLGFSYKEVSPTLEEVYLYYFGRK